MLCVWDNALISDLVMIVVVTSPVMMLVLLFVCRRRQIEMRNRKEGLLFLHICKKRASNRLMLEGKIMVW